MGAWSKFVAVEMERWRQPDRLLRACGGALAMEGERERKSLG